MRTVGSSLKTQLLFRQGQRQIDIEPTKGFYSPPTPQPGSHSSATWSPSSSVLTPMSALPCLARCYLSPMIDKLLRHLFTLP